MGSAGRAAIWWVRRDFRLALRSAIDDGDAVLARFVSIRYFSALPAALGGHG
jgi:hypothetical protein